MGQAGPGGFAAELGMRLGGGGLGAPSAPRDFAGAEMQEAGNDLSLAEAEAPPFLGGGLFSALVLLMFSTLLLFCLVSFPPSG